MIDRDELLEPYTVAKNVVRFLLKADYKYLQNTIMELVRQNNELFNMDGISFVHKGYLYCIDANFAGDFVVPSATVSSLSRESGNAPSYLHPSLHETAEAARKHNNQLHRDNEELPAFFCRIIQDCDTKQDVRDALPECVVTVNSYLSSMPRTRPELYTIASNDTLRDWYKLVSMRLHAYSAMHLIS